MLITKTQDGVTVTGQYREIFPNTSFPASGPSDAWLEKNGFSRVPKSADEFAAEVRAERNQLLSATDWRFRSDLTPSQQWIDYCQALRDISSQDGFPTNVIWPASPE